MSQRVQMKSPAKKLIWGTTCYTPFVYIAAPQKQQIENKYLLNIIYGGAM